MHCFKHARCFYSWSRMLREPGCLSAYTTRDLSFRGLYTDEHNHTRANAETPVHTTHRRQHPHNILPPRSLSSCNFLSLHPSAALFLFKKMGKKIKNRDVSFAEAARYGSNMYFLLKCQLSLYLFFILKKFHFDRSSVTSPSHDSRLVYSVSTKSHHIPVHTTNKSHQIPDIHERSFMIIRWRF